VTSRPRVLPLLAAALASIALAAGCSSDNGDSAAQGTTSTASSRLVDLKSVDDLRAAFNAKPGVPRLILLPSPT
jgi:ABC-type glycerol-3-phosphate transport system substrate-binding protein